MLSERCPRVIAHPRDIGSLATTSRSSVSGLNTFAVRPRTGKKENNAGNKVEIYIAVIIISAEARKRLGEMLGDLL